MVSLSLVELSVKKEKKTENIQTPSSDSNNAFGLCYYIANPVSYITVVNDVTSSMQKGNYELKTKYTMIYLYDQMNDRESIDFISLYGGKLHNQSSSNITILTYFTPGTAEKWTNVQCRDMIKCGSIDAINAHNVIDNLKIAYDVKKLPALVIVKKNEDDKEEYCTIDFSSYKIDGIYSSFKEIMEIINDNCEEDFSVISHKICGPDAKIQKGSNIRDFDTANFIGNLIKNESKQSVQGYTQFDLAAELGMCRSTLKNRMDINNLNNFTRDECLKIGIKFAIEIDVLNEFLRAMGHNDLGLDGRDGIIRLCLLHGNDINTTNEKLLKNHYVELQIAPKLRE